MEPAVELQSFVRDIADFPEPGVVYKDITPLLADRHAFDASITALASLFDGQPVDVVAGIEARGFLFGPPVAQALGVGFVPIRKPGKLPAATHRISYDLEYGSDELEMHVDAPVAGASVLLVDDVLATGGTLRATEQLIGKAGGRVVGAAVLIELLFLGARIQLPDIDVRSVLEVA